VVQTVNVPAGKHSQAVCTITAETKPVQSPKIFAHLDIPKKPRVTVPFDDIEVVPVIRVRPEPVMGLLPASPLVIDLKNQDVKPQSGKIELFLENGSTPIAQADFASLNPGGETHVSVNLKSDLPVPAFNEWPMVIQTTLADGKTTRESLAVDFACAVHADTPPLLDGDLSDWSDATPLHLNRSEYAKGSYGLNWSPEDCSGTVYLKWDTKNVYFAARVKDQTFNQNLHGESIWSQDSIQIAFGQDPNLPGTEMGLALTPQGEEVFCFAKAGDVADAKMKVAVSQGQIIYEAAIPWSALDGIGPITDGKKLRFSVLFNDNDAVIPRRFLERFGGIAHGKNVNEFGYLILVRGANKK
jgi:hypothetical protein